MCLLLQHAAAISSIDDVHAGVLQGLTTAAAEDAPAHEAAKGGQAASIAPVAAAVAAGKPESAAVRELHKVCPLIPSILVILFVSIALCGSLSM